MQPFEIVHSVQSKFRGIHVKLSGITGKCTELFLSHGREAKSRNPMQSGNLSPVDAIFTYCRRYEACEQGAGQMLIDYIHAVLSAEFLPPELVTPAKAHKEAAEAIQSDLEDKPRKVKEQEYVEAVVTFSHRLQELKEEILPEHVRVAIRARNGANGNGNGNGHK